MKDCKDTTKQATKRTDYKLFKNVPPPPEYFAELIRISKNQIIWGVNFFDYDLTGGRIVWDKKQTAFGRGEIAYYSGSKSVEIFEYTWNGMLQENMKDKEIRIHPTQKPVGLYRWLLENYTQENDLILDTHLGSGSIAIACHYMKRRLIGYEIDKEYYDGACKRFKEETAQLTLW